MQKQQKSIPQEVLLTWELIHFSDQALISFDDIDLKSAIQYIHSNGLSGYIYQKLSNKENLKPIEKTLKDLLRPLYIQNALQTERQVNVFIEIQQLLKKSDINIIPLKGMSLLLSQYKSEASRPMGDIDIYINQHQILKARDLLIYHGAKALSIPKSQTHELTHGHIRPLLYKNVMLELHPRLYALGNPFHLKKTILEKHLTESTFKNQTTNILSDALQLYHLTTHAALGNSIGGMRMSWLLDIAMVLNNNNTPIDLLSQLYQLNAKANKSITEIFALCKELLTSEKANYLNNFLLKQSPFNQLSIAQCQSIKGDKDKHRQLMLKEALNTPGLRLKIALLFREFFPSKEYMQFKYSNSQPKTYLKRLLNVIMPS